MQIDFPPVIGIRKIRVVVYSNDSANKIQTSLYLFVVQNFYFIKLLSLFLKFNLSHSIAARYLLLNPFSIIEQSICQILLRNISVLE